MLASGQFLEEDDVAIKALRREQDNSIYAYRCTRCGSAWKVYQKPAHSKIKCLEEAPSRAQEREVAIDTKQTIASVLNATKRPRKRRH